MTPYKERFAIQADFCKAMAHPVRLEIIDRLKRRPHPVGELSAAIGVGHANLSQHLAVLRARGVVRARRQGVGVVYSLANPKIVEACSLIREILVENLDQQVEVVVPP